MIIIFHRKHTLKVCMLYELTIIIIFRLTINDLVEQTLCVCERGGGRDTDKTFALEYFDSYRTGCICYYTQRRRVENLPNLP